MTLDEVLRCLRKYSWCQTRLEVLSFIFMADLQWRGPAGEMTPLDGANESLLLQAARKCTDLSDLGGKNNVIPSISARRRRRTAYLGQGARAMVVPMGRNACIRYMPWGVRPDWLAGARSFLHAFETGKLRMYAHRDSYSRHSLARIWKLVDSTSRYVSQLNEIPRSHPSAPAGAAGGDAA